MVGSRYDRFENPYEQFVDDVRDRIHFLARTSPRLNEHDFQLRVVVSGDPQFVTRYELWQDTGDGMVRLIPTEGVDDVVDRRDEFLDEIERTRELLRE